MSARVVAAALCLSAITPASAQDKLPAPPVRSTVLAYQQLGLSLESLMAYYEARIADLVKRCGDPCKDDK